MLIQQVLNRWKYIASNLPSSATTLEQLLLKESDYKKGFVKSEFDLLDLTAQINGLEAKIQSLTRDHNKLNALPQIIPILTSEMETYLENMKVTSLKLQNLETETIRPTIHKLTDLSIAAPIKRKYYESELRLMYDLIDSLDQIYKVSLKQRSIQQIIFYLNERAQSTTHSTIHNLQNCLQELRKETDLIAGLKDGAIKRQASNDNPTALLLLTQKLEVILADVLYKKSDADAPLSMVEKIDSVVEHKAQLEKGWEDELQNALDISTEL
ncbi:hypothetical protein BDF20DRAFT_480806 [Mycotypha africana]|uniref:uncharacterized protein n=1 Tax=Mycotypha africana TaxID=64632 RepID=UPI00230176E6|nr:uncharacterized protein BDF20DRAFT_480806 [Mycotypha africana]KAI8979126.1 hypothetical protein BDF20DRAFT_480806 [Mycotypha africana]